MILLSQRTADPPGNASPKRYTFLDQSRGYAIFGMILVNVLGEFACMPWMLKHHHAGFSYADHIAPMFMFVVGMGFRMSFLKTMRRDGINVARKRALKRNGILIMLGLVYGGFHLRAGVWDALMDIGVSGILALPVIHASVGVRLVVAGASLGLFQAIFSCTDYGGWLVQNSINGGPLGPLSWVFILLMGTIAIDGVFALRRKKMLLTFLAAAILLGVIGWLLRMEWGTTKAFWPFSQFAMTAPYPVFATGLCFFTISVFYLLCECAGIVFPQLTALGRNPLVLYLLQAGLVLVVRGTMQLWSGLSESVAGALLVFLFVYGVCYMVAQNLYVKGKVIKL